MESKGKNHIALIVGEREVARIIIKVSDPIDLKKYFKLTERHLHELIGDRVDEIITLATKEPEDCES